MVESDLPSHGTINCDTILRIDKLTPEPDVGQYSQQEIEFELDTVRR